jgi:hypothetical protein
MIRRGRVRDRGGRRWLAVVAAALAACGVAAAVPSAALAAGGDLALPGTAVRGQALNWTQQQPSAHPPSLVRASMADDAAVGTVVLFGGQLQGGRFAGSTWTWNGTTWTQEHPATHPSPREDAAMAYDGANGTVVLFGGRRGSRHLGDTWAWNGTTWTEEHPATHPSPRFGASMAYDAATGTVVLFGGSGRHGLLNAAWTWNGSTWAQQSPATRPVAQAGTVMAYDAATGTVVLFAAAVRQPPPLLPSLDSTWTWDGSTWTRQSPAASPPARIATVMAYDAATGTVVLFGGAGNNGTTLLGDTWAWDGSTWTQQAPATSPPARANASMAYDAASGTVVLFGGNDPRGLVHDTWTWG